MSCDLTSGRSRPCQDSKPGIDNVLFIPRTELGKDAFTIVGNEVTAIDVAITEIFEWVIRGHDENVLTINKAENGRDSGASVWTENFVLKVKKVDKATSAEINILAKSNPNVIAVDNMGNYRLLGLSEGCYSTIEEASGGAKTDYNGYTITFEQQEFELAPYVDDATVTALKALISSTVINP